MRIAKPNNHGYPYVQLCKESKYKGMTVHRLVAEAYLPNPENKPCVDHIDGVRTNCTIENLQWVTHKENYASATARGINSSTTNIKKRKNMTPEKVAKAKELRLAGWTYKNIATELGVTAMTIHGIITGKFWKEEKHA
jgi:hypothetical protein